MKKYILLTLLFLYTIPGDVIGQVSEFACDQPFGTKPDEGFSIIRKVTIDFFVIRTNCHPIRN